MLSEFFASTSERSFQIINGALGPPNFGFYLFRVRAGDQHDHNTHTY